MQNSAENIRWDLSFLYKGLDDSQLGKDLQQWLKMAKAFFTTHKGKLHETLGQAIRDYAELGMLSSKISVYSQLVQCVVTSDASAKAKSQELLSALFGAAGDWLEFFEIELANLDGARISALAEENPVVKKHLPWIQQIRDNKEHLLSEEVEMALTKRLPFGPHVWSEFFDEIEADLRFPWEDKEATLTEMFHVLNENEDAEKRAEALKIINTGFAGYFSKYSAQMLNVVVGTKRIEDHERGYAHPMEARNKSNRIPDAVVEALHDAVVVVGGPLVRRYYQLKAKHLGMTTLRWSDHNAPMPFKDTSIIPWSKAVSIVLSAYESFSPTLAKLVNSIVVARRIDAPAVVCKQGGAFCCSVCLPNDEPVSLILLNYIGSSDDVMTLAHELGHGAHGLLAGKAQGALLMNAPVAYCETASIFGEMTTFNFIKAEAEKSGGAKSALALLMDRIDSSMNAVVRQISFSNFERRLHGSGKRLSAAELDAIWIETTQAMYGAPGEVFTYEDTEHLWAYVNHFHNPFYVYGYAFGQLFSQSLYAQRDRLGERFEPLYLDLLSSGGSKNAVELMAPFGLDPTSPEFWADGLKNGIGKMIEEAERLSRDLGMVV